MNAPDPIDFGVSGMAAALSMTEDEVRAAYRRGDIATPDTVRNGGPRWSALALAAEVKKRMPAGLDPIIYSMEALLRAERAEGWHDEGADHAK